MTTSRTYSPRPRDIERRWYVVDGDGAVLGRLASEVASVLRGKHKPIYAPHADTGDHVIVVNAAGVRLTGGKEDTKVAYRHSGYPGGLTAVGYSRLMAERPAFVVEKAIKGMLPKNRLGRSMARKLMVYPGPEHPHAAQKPEALALGTVPAWSGLPKPEPKPERPARPAKKTAPKSRAGAARPAAKRTTGRGTATPRTRAASTSAAKRTSKASTATTAAEPETTTKTKRTPRRARKQAEKE